MKISVIIPAYNEEKLIGATLDHVRRAMQVFDENGWAGELIVCDNNSTDRTAELARAGGATVVFEPINQIGRARNCGANAATGKWLIFVDADSQPTRELFADVVEQIKSGKILYGGVTIKLDGKHRIANLITELWNLISRLGKYVAGSFIFCEASAFRDIGGFDHRLFAGEEIELRNRLKKLAQARGKRAVILHRHPLVSSARKIHLYSGREHLRFLWHAVTARNRTLQDRDACSNWYDGRR